MADEYEYMMHHLKTLERHEKELVETITLKQKVLDDVRKGIENLTSNNLEIRPGVKRTEWMCKCGYKTDNRYELVNRASKLHCPICHELLGYREDG